MSLPGVDSPSEPMTLALPDQPAPSTEDAGQSLASTSFGPNAMPSPTAAPQANSVARPRRLNWFVKRIAQLLGVSRPEPPDYLDEAEIRQRLRLNSKDLVDQVYGISLRILDGDDKRGSALDSKATSLLGAVGLSLTVAFTFGGTLLEHPERFSGIGIYVYKGVVGIYALALMSGLAAGYFALRTLQIRTHRSIDEQDFLKSDVLSASESDEAGGVTYYKRFLVAHYLNVSHENSVVYDDKAFRIQLGQKCFFAFLFGLLLIGGALVWSALGLPTLPSPAKSTTVTAAKLDTPLSGTGGPISVHPPPSSPPPPLPSNRVIAPQARIPDGGSAPAVEGTSVTSPPKSPGSPVRQTSSNQPPRTPPPPTPSPGKGREVMGTVKKPVR